MSIPPSQNTSGLNRMLPEPPVTVLPAEADRGTSVVRGPVVWILEPGAGG